MLSKYKKDPNPYIKIIYLHKYEQNIRPFHILNLSLFSSSCFLGQLKKVWNMNYTQGFGECMPATSEKLCGVDS